MKMTYHSKAFVTLLATAAAAFFATPLRTWAAPSGETKFAFVDIQRALNECRNGKSVKAEFRTKIEHLQDRLQGEESEVERLKKELEQKGALMQPDQRQNLEDEYTKKLHQFQDDYKNSQADLKQKDNEMTGEIVQDIALVVQQIGQKNGYTMVMEKGSLLWAVPQMDITDEVVRAYDAMNVKPGGLLHEAISGSRGHFGSAAGRQAESAVSEPPTHGSSTITK